MKYLTLVPRYGRDYNSAKAVKEAWLAGNDFTVADISSRYDGMAANREDMLNEKPITVNIRYRKLASIYQEVFE